MLLFTAGEESADSADAGAVKRRSRHHITSTLQLNSNSDAAADAGLTYLAGGVV